jgi:hypothetical protein
MAGVPQLGSNKEFRTRDTRILDGLTNFLFVTVYCSFICLLALCIKTKWHLFLELTDIGSIDVLVTIKIAIYLSEWRSLSFLFDLKLTQPSKQSEQLHELHWA